MQDKRSAILQATLELVAENGFHNTPVSKIAKQSRVSAGIIYHYFDDKDDLIRALYAEIKKNLASVLMQGNPHLLPWPESLKRIWLNAYHYYAAHPRETRFLEQYENSPYFQGNEDPEYLLSLGDYADLVNMLQGAIGQGLVKPLPYGAFYDLTLGVAISLAKRKISGGLSLDEATLEMIADAVCSAVAQG
ncbi:MAG: TetR/AcrR family transcriptional regulator [Anaerolineae bacterium]|nr:TetR/AcrR family transcriptional regulator [Anaerolineae bacterium]